MQGYTVAICSKPQSMKRRQLQGRIRKKKAEVTWTFLKCQKYWWEAVVLGTRLKIRNHTANHAGTRLNTIKEKDWKKVNNCLDRKRRWIEFFSWPTPSQISTVLKGIDGIWSDQEKCKRCALSFTFQIVERKKEQGRVGGTLLNFKTEHS